MKLFTNLRYVGIKEKDAQRGIRTHCSALLLEPPDPEFLDTRKEPRLRGFGPDSGWEVFDLRLGDEAFAVSDYSTGMVVLGDSGRELPVGGGLRVVFGDGLELLLDVEDRRQAVKIDDCEGMDITDVWSLLERRTADFWASPFMPHLFHGPPSAPHLAVRHPRQRVR